MTGETGAIKVKKAKKSSDIISRYMGFVDGDVIPSLIEGRVGGLYHDREVVVFRHIPGLFGTRFDGMVRVRKLTIHNGILNQCSMELEVTPYWAVMDSMSELKTNFTRNQVIDLAVKLTGEDQRKACEMSWDVLRNHHRHARKCYAGMGYMVDTSNSGRGVYGGRLSIRARCADETVQFFLSERGRKQMAKDFMANIQLAMVEKDES
jgi:hypothetical protein